MKDTNLLLISSKIETVAKSPVSAVFTLKSIRQVKENQTVLDEINLDIEQGVVTSLIGPSGAGKTSLLRLLNRLDDPAGGQIFYRSQPIGQYPVRDLRRQIGFVFQTPVMFPGTVGDNLRQALELAGNSNIDSKELIEEMLSLTELGSAMVDREGAKLSVGQKQRVNIARALMTSPEVLLMDEPTSALDPETADKLMETIHRLSREKKLTIIMITHRLLEARRTSDRIIVMEAGRIIETNTTENIFEMSSNPRIREFLKSGK